MDWKDLLESFIEFNFLISLASLQYFQNIIQKSRFIKSAKEQFTFTLITVHVLGYFFSW